MCFQCVNIKKSIRIGISIFKTFVWPGIYSFTALLLPIVLVNIVIVVYFYPRLRIRYPELIFVVIIKVSEAGYMTIHSISRTKPSEWVGIVALSPIGRIQILTYLIWGFLGAAIFDCIIRSCDLFYWFIRTCLDPTVIPATITSLELVCVLTMCYFSDNVSSKENIKILWLIFMFYFGDIIAIKNSFWFFSFT